MSLWSVAFRTTIWQALRTWFLGGSGARDCRHRIDVVSYSKLTMRMIALVALGLALGSVVSAQKVWREIEVTHNCLQAEAILRSYDDVIISRDCAGQGAGILQGTVKWLFDSYNVAFDISFLWNRNTYKDVDNEFTLLEFKPGASPGGFINTVIRSFTEAYGDPEDRRSTRPGERMPSGGVFWQRGDGLKALLFVAPSTGEPHVMITFVRNDADQF